MRAALALAARGLGRVWPNPAVGCVLVKDGRVVGRGWTQPGGRPHAETEALRRAGEAARGATAYVTLEPCSHHGETPPCADALIAAAIARAVIATEDPDRRVSGKGAAALREAGVAVTESSLSIEARDLNRGYFKRTEAGLPLVTLKTATTLDGKIAAHTGQSRWITGEWSRAAAHRLRATHDAVVIGVGTAAVDDPDLTCRLPGLEDASPVRVVVDPRLRLPLTHRLIATAGTIPTWIVATPTADPERRRAFEQAGAKIITVGPLAGAEFAMADVLKALAERGVTRLLAEGGSRLTAALLRENLIDRVAWFRAPRIMGGDGIPVAGPIGVDSVESASRFVRVSAREIGDDRLETYVFQG
jgi:diaminohydroxyphosphoribosylaminopyrimidine deaminase/5-amino-6-(5-phosphoribosylamino)uracil reductase